MSQLTDALYALVDEEFGTAEEAVETIMEATGLEEDDVLDLFEGAAVPDESLTIDLIELFDATANDPDAAEGLFILANDAFLDAQEYNDEVEASLDEDFDDEDDEGEYDEEDDDDEDEEDDDEDDEDETEASYGSGIELGVLGDIEDVATQVAEFQMRDAINEELDDLEEYANKGIKEGWLSHGLKKMILGEFSKDSKRLAKFSSVCETNQVDAATQLYGMNYALKVIEALGPLNLLNVYGDEEISEEEAQFSAGEDQITDALAQGSLLLYKANRR